MALTKIIEVEGASFVQTPMGLIENGNQKIAFVSYVSVLSISGNKTRVTANVSFKGEKHQFEKLYVVPVSVALNSKNFIAQTYEYLKTLPEFDGAEDC